MNQEEIIKRLREPFSYDEIEWRILNTTQDKTRGLAVPFVDSRAVQNRLDSAVGAFNWRSEFIPWHTGAQLCGISIYNEVRDEWVLKYDGAECGDIEPVKSGISDAFKRAAVHWNIGRYLYDMEPVWAEVEQRGKGSYIKDNQRDKLKSEYDRAVARIFGVAVPQTGASAAPSAKQTPAQPVSQVTEKEKTHQSASQQEANNQPPATATYDFTVKAVKPSGKNSQLLELINGDGEVIKAYIKTGDSSISSGSCLRKVQMERKQSSYGEYNLINAYQIAA